MYELGMVLAKRYATVHVFHYPPLCLQTETNSNESNCMAADDRIDGIFIHVDVQSQHHLNNSH